MIMIAARALADRDPAALLASTLGLGSSIVLAALASGIFGGWLALGGTSRIAAIAGFFAGIGAILMAWRLARPYVWVVDVVMNQTFGEGGDAYSGFVLILIAIPLSRTIARGASALAGRILEGRPR